MTEEQLKHYLKGGYFKAKYVPNKDLIHEECWPFIGDELIVYANTNIGPIVTGNYKGEFRFNCNAFLGWFPESDIEILFPIEKFKEVDSLPIWIYKLTYDKEEQLIPNFGIGYSKKDLPLIVEREYSTKRDDHIMKLSTPQATKIERTKFDGSLPLKWKTITIYEQS